jgi:hypothetical protein
MPTVVQGQQKRLNKLEKTLKKATQMDKRMNRVERMMEKLKTNFGSSGSLNVIRSLERPRGSRAH